MTRKFAFSIRAACSAMVAAMGVGAAGFALAPAARAQATLHDPVLLAGNQAQSIAGTAALNAAQGAGPGPSAAELARRKAHRDAHSACRKQALSQPAGSAPRRAVRDRCRAAFEAQKATWYDPAHQLP